MHQVPPDVTWVRAVVILVIAILVVKAIFSSRGRYALVAALGLFVASLFVYGATWRVRSVVQGLPRVSTSKLEIELRPTRATDAVSGHDLALVLRSLLFEMATEKDPTTLDGILDDDLDRFLEQVVTHDPEAHDWKLRQLAHLRYLPPPEKGLHDYVVELTPGLSKGTLYADTVAAIHSYVGQQQGRAPFILEDTGNALALRLPAGAAIHLAPAEYEVAKLVVTADHAEAPQADDGHVESEGAAAEPPHAAAAEPATKRPAWVNDTARQQDGKYAIVVSAGPYVTINECQEHIDEELQKQVRAYLVELLGADGFRVKPSLPEIRGWEAPTNRYVETIQHPEYGAMHTMYARVLIEPAVQAELSARYRQAKIQDRIGIAGAGTGLMLAALGTVFGYLRLDTATRGYYRGRLGVVAAASMLTILVLGSIALRRFDLFRF